MTLLLGLGTRFSALSLMVVTLVATAAIHWPADWHTLSELAQGYAISNKGYGNFKLPLIYLVAFTPLLLSGGGKLSIDALLARLFWRR
jgi:putative oxidoreductase